MFISISDVLLLIVLIKTKDSALVSVVLPQCIMALLFTNTAARRMAPSHLYILLHARDLEMLQHSCPQAVTICHPFTYLHHAVIDKSLVHGPRKQIEFSMSLPSTPGAAARLLPVGEYILCWSPVDNKINIVDLYSHAKCCCGDNASECGV